MAQKRERVGALASSVGILLLSGFVLGCGSGSGTIGGQETGGSSGTATGGAGAAAQGGESGGPGDATGGQTATGGAAGSGSAAAGAAGAAAAAGSAGAGAAGAGTAGQQGAAGAGGAAGKGGGAGGAGGHAGASGGAGGGSAGHAGAGGAGGSATLPNVTIWIAGDSTVMTYPEPNTDGNNMVSLYGWGQEIGQFFSTKATVNNQAIGGRSVAFFMWSVVQDSAGNYQCVDTQGTPEFQMNNGSKVNTSQWSRILNGMKAGDFLLIQFGTNDETHTCPRYVSLPDFETDFGIMADAARAKGATPIFVTPMGHRTFSGTTASNTLLPYANAMKDEATQKTVEVEDLNLESEAYYTSVGNSYLAATIFDGGTTHFTEAGATEMASLVVKEIRKNNGPLAAYLK
jgi:lysophospholipase L1-like esterase